MILKPQQHSLHKTVESWKNLTAKIKEHVKHWSHLTQNWAELKNFTSKKVSGSLLRGYSHSSF